VAFTLRQDDDHVLRSVNIGRPVVLNGTRSQYGQDVKGWAWPSPGASPDAGEERGGGLMNRLTPAWADGGN
jgi:hypothetical protein